MNGGGLGNRAGAGDREGGFGHDTVDKDDGTNDIVITVSSGTLLENEARIASNLLKCELFNWIFCRSPKPESYKHL